MWLTQGYAQRKNFPDAKTVLDGEAAIIRRHVSIGLACLFLSMTKIVFLLEAKIRQVYCPL